MTINPIELAEYGWDSHFTSQLTPEDFESSSAARVIAVHRNALDVIGPDIAGSVPPFSLDGEEEGGATVGDWLLVDPHALRVVRMLDRKSLFKRRAAGKGRRLQMIAANVDTLFIVTSCNQDFNIARLERYLALAREAGATPVIVLTKADLTGAPAEFEQAAARLMPALAVETVDARDAASVERLAAWCGRGETIALVGSSGVGKSTLINTLTGNGTIATRSVREDDDKGRHTTTGRTLHRLPTGGWLLDTPGMRELQLADVQAGLDEVFADIIEVANSCRFRDCRHEGEPGCAVGRAIETGALEPDRVHRWRKLVAEEAHNTASLAERRSRDKDFGRMVRRIMKDKKHERGE